jgi:hypothetical protein
VRRHRVWIDRALSLATAGVVVMALYFVITDRVIPALRGEPVRIVEGESLTSRLEFEVLDGSDSSVTLTLPGATPALLLVFSSTCAACYANLPAWREVIDAVGDRVKVLAVGIEADRMAALQYAETQLPSAMPVVPEDPYRFAGILGVDMVPFTALVDASGTLRFVRQGSLDAGGIESLIRALGVLAGSSNP